MNMSCKMIAKASKPIFVLSLGLFSLSAFGQQGAATLLEREADQSSENAVYSKARRYHFGVGAAKPLKIGNDYNHYSLLFGAPELYPEVWGEYYFLHFGVDFGFRMKLAYYSDKGRPADNINATKFPYEADLDHDNVDENQDSQLTLVPIETSLSVSYSPFFGRYLVFQAWFGHQFVYVENTMRPKQVSDAGESAQIFLNQGWNRELTSGFALSIDLSWLEPRAAYAMNAYGVSGIFMTPFYERVDGRSTSYGVYDRETFGLMFTFESTVRDE